MLPLATVRLRGLRHASSSPRIGPAPAGPAPASRRLGLPLDPGLRPADGILPAALILWGASLSTVDLSTMNDYGLLAALPAGFYLALALLVLSILVTLHDSRPSPVRFALHVACLVLVLHGTVPLILSAPNYPWTFKHVGVTDYVNLHGGVRASTDIYQSWPGFFALAAWFTKLAGVGSPLAYAAWAPVYFNLLNCLMLSFAFASLPVTRATRWLAMFLFVAANWVGQDYFAPQALAFVLTLAVFALLLSWFGAERRPAAVLAASALAHRLVGGAGARGRRAANRRVHGPAGRRELQRLWVAAGGQPADARAMGGVLHRSQRSGRPPVTLHGAWHDVARLSVLFAVFAAVVVTHQLSPYMIVMAVGVLTAAGTVRPRWIVAGLALVTVGYLIPRLPYLQQTQDVFGSLLHPFGNVGLDRPTAARLNSAIGSSASLPPRWCSVCGCSPGSECSAGCERAARRWCSVC